MTEFGKVDFRWCRDRLAAAMAASVFSANITPTYISHSELQGPRATAPGVWVSNIEDVLVADLSSRVDSPLDAQPGGQTKLAALLEAHGEVCGVILITFSREAPLAYCILEDIVIDEQLRGQGIGAHCLTFIEAECRLRGISRIFLESGNENRRAHEFFHHRGFDTISVVMMKSLS